MPPKKDKKSKGPAIDEPGQDPESLKTKYSTFCKGIGLVPSPEVMGALTEGEDNPFVGRQIIIKPGAAPLGPGGCRALATAIMGIGAGMPRDPETGNPIMYKQLQELRIWGGNIGDDGAASIAELLRLGGAEIKLAYLELTNNCISSTGAFALGRSLSCMMNMSLVTLALDYNRELMSEGCAALCRGLRTNSTLKKLSLKYCDLDQEAGGPLGEVLAFTKCGLNVLDLQGNRIGGFGLTDFCPGLRRNKSLTALIIADNNINAADEDKEGLAVFKETLLVHPTIAEVNMQYNRIGEHGAEILLPVLENKNLGKFLVDMSLPTEIWTKLNKDGGGGKKGKKGKKKCDRRLKVDVDCVVERGVEEPGLYVFRYKGEEGGRRHVGVMAQECLEMEGYRERVSAEFDQEDGVHFEVDEEIVLGHSRYSEFEALGLEM